MDRISTLTLDSKRSDIPASHLRRAYEAQRALFHAQPQAVQRFLEGQAGQLAEALVRDSSVVRFNLPDQVYYEAIRSGEAAPIPVDQREQKIGGIAVRMRHTRLHVVLNQRLAALESSPNEGIAKCASLIRYATASYMVKHMLPSGRSVTYKAAQGDEIPNLPVTDDIEASPEAGQDELAVPFVPQARRFYLPQWVVFDEQGRLLVNSINEARAQVASMQAFMSILGKAANLAPYILADAEYQQKRYGIMGQLVNQGRLLARYETNEIIQAIWQRVKSNKLNRGLSLSLPYFDDQDMELKNLDFVAIPAGRIMFVPAFLVLAICEAQAKVTRYNQMSPSTRQHLLAELKSLEKAFDVGDQQ